MKIAVDCCDLDHERIDGTRIYIKNLLNHLGGLAPKDEFWLFHRENFNPSLRPRFFPNYHDQKIPYPFWWTHTRFAYETKRAGFDVVWLPIQQLPLLRNKKTRYVVSIHDLAWKHFPGNYSFFNRLKLDFFAETAIKRANKIIAISEATKQDILRFYPKTNPDKITVVYHGFDRAWLEREFSSEEKAELEKKYGIQKKHYLLYVGGLDDKENVGVLVEAFDLLKKQGGHRNLKLVLVGERESNSQKTWQKINASDCREDIVVTGRVDFEELALFYNLAKIFVLPSRYEGFGLPILEAFVAEAPVVAAGSGASPEVGSDGAHYFDGKNHRELKERLEEILVDEKLEADMITKGLERAAHFSWEKCAQETLAVIKG